MFNNSYRPSPVSVKRRGFTLTEIAIVLGVVGTVLGAIWSAAAHVSNNQKVAKAVTEIISLSHDIRAMYPSGQIVGGGQFISPLLVNNGDASGDMLASCTGAGMYWGAGGGGTNGCITSPWSTQIIVGSQGGWGNTPVMTNRFEIYIFGLTNAQCSAFLSALVPQAVNDGLVEVYADANLPVQTVSSSTPVTTFSTCSGSVVLQFQL